MRPRTGQPQSRKSPKNNNNRPRKQNFPVTESQAKSDSFLTQKDTPEDPRRKRYLCASAVVKENERALKTPKRKERRENSTKRSRLAQTTTLPFLREGATPETKRNAREQTKRRERATTTNGGSQLLKQKGVSMTITAEGKQQHSAKRKKKKASG